MVSFDIPYPPNYGGTIDVFYKLEALAGLGVKIILHSFEYNKERQAVLDKICEKVYYYPRNTVFRSLFSTLPFIVISRANNELITNLQKDESPILFEGIHTIYPLLKEVFKHRVTLIRMHNIEHFYYDGLAKSEVNFFKKVFYKLEAFKLKKAEKHLAKANYLMAISPSETAYYHRLFGKRVVFLPPFHENTDVQVLSKKGDFALYHGDLRVPDNYRAALFLIDIFKDIDYPLVIAGSYYPKNLQTKIASYSHITWLDISDNIKLKAAFSEAHINVLLSFQKTGIKLKLINALYQSRFVVGNDFILNETGLEAVCALANTKESIRNTVLKLIDTEYTAEHISAKEKVLAYLNVKKNAEQILNLL